MLSFFVNEIIEIYETNVDRRAKKDVFVGSGRSVLLTESTGLMVFGGMFVFLISGRHSSWAALDDS